MLLLSRRLRSSVVKLANWSASLKGLISMTLTLALIFVITWDILPACVVNGGFWVTTLMLLLFEVVVGVDSERCGDLPPCPCSNKSSTSGRERKTDNVRSCKKGVFLKLHYNNEIKSTLNIP